MFKSVFRPFHKRLDRVLLGSLRGSEALAAIGWAKGNDELVEGNLASRLSKARMWHSLFQHHDGVTGTSRDNVVIDYAQKMIAALNNSAHVLQQSVAHLLRTRQTSPIDVEAVYFSLDETRYNSMSQFSDKSTNIKSLTKNKASGTRCLFVY